MNRAYSLIEVKALDRSRRAFSGWATTPSVDRVGDTIDPMGARFTNPLVLLHQHFHDSPVGTVRLMKPTPKGIEFEAEIPVVNDAGPFKDRTDTAWQEIEHGVVRAVSIGFKPLKYAFRDDGGIDYQEIEIYEVSSVSIPANADAIISAVKSIDAAARKANGIPDPDRPEPEIPSAPEPAASGKSARVVRLNAPPASRQPFIIREIRRT